MKISALFYSALAFVILGAVLFGLDWQPATLSPMAPIQVVALPPPPPPVAAAKPAVPNPSTTNPSTTSPATTGPVATRPAAPKVAAPPVAVPPVAVAPPAEAPKPLCDIAACTQAYHSFTASDCTYLSSTGRRLCTKGVVPTAAAAPAAATAPASSDAPAAIMPNSIMQEERGAQPAAPPGTASNIKCNVGACATAYRTFTESDCTFMGSGGVRKLCTK